MCRVYSIWCGVDATQLLPRKSRGDNSELCRLLYKGMYQYVALQPQHTGVDSSEGPSPPQFRSATRRPPVRFRISQNLSHLATCITCTLHEPWAQQLRLRPVCGPVHELLTPHRDLIRIEARSSVGVALCGSLCEPRHDVVELILQLLAEHGARRAGSHAAAGADAQGCAGQQWTEGQAEAEREVELDFPGTVRLHLQGAGELLKDPGAFPRPAHAVGVPAYGQPVPSGTLAGKHQRGTVRQRLTPAGVSRGPRPRLQTVAGLPALH